MVAHDLEVDDAAVAVVRRGDQTTIAAKCNTMAMIELRRARTRVSNSRTAR
jgi:hypothetical protein